MIKSGSTQVDAMVLEFERIILELAEANAIKSGELADLRLSSERLTAELKALTDKISSRKRSKKPNAEVEAT